MRLRARHVNDSGDFGCVALLLGGDAAEREVSLISGRFVHEALTRLGVDHVSIDPADGDLGGQLRAAEVDRALIMLHGPGGEDGTVQEEISRLTIPYGVAIATGTLLHFSAPMILPLFRQGLGS